MSKQLREPAFLPLPKNEKFVQRKCKFKNKGKDKLESYESKFLNEFYNLSLAFYKYAPDISENLSESKRAWLKTLIENFNFDKSSIPETNIYHLISNVENNQEIENKIKNFVFSNESKAEILAMQTAQPLIVGLGEASPYETSITLDFLTGLPIIPGSALKGITRRAAIMNLSGNTDILPYGEEFEELAKEYENHHEIIEIFGTQDQKGKVIFPLCQDRCRLKEMGF
ncbi:MAG: type III-B CRISPR module RAMP protein Cmr6 [Desulfonauticus sp.]|nr:type III-B CRISPR module RAMP protein Cmr6 [Desulfonauticus sp.]